MVTTTTTSIPDPALARAIMSDEHFDPATRVLAWGWIKLDDRSDRVASPSVIARRLGLRRQTVARALAQLTARGFLRPGAKRGRSLTFRLAHPERPIINRGAA